jgi:hypothetical protein
MENILGCFQPLSDQNPSFSYEPPVVKLQNTRTIEVKLCIHIEGERRTS